MHIHGALGGSWSGAATFCRSAAPRFHAGRRGFEPPPSPPPPQHDWDPPEKNDRVARGQTAIIGARTRTAAGPRV